VEHLNGKSLEIMGTVYVPVDLLGKIGWDHTAKTDAVDFCEPGQRRWLVVTRSGCRMEAYVDRDIARQGVARTPATPSRVTTASLSELREGVGIIAKSYVENNEQLQNYRISKVTVDSRNSADWVLGTSSEAKAAMESGLDYHAFIHLSHESDPHLDGFLVYNHFAGDDANTWKLADQWWPQQ
jgi:hypothetical protein